ncbi:MFS transporter [Actinomadura fibrosa]|uniref:MFS transporter n=1 Tax=Actinomadura fibrosa TaxID=111802 RepID=A0ABW2XHE3_9ACTN|nr:MFS transporter [Actinomadura fibrosa]
MIGRTAGLPLHLTAATLLRVSAEGMATALVLTVQARTGHAATAGYLQTAMTLPYVLSGPVIGSAIDRAARPRRLAVALAAGYAAAGTLLLLIAGRSPMAAALCVAALVGCGEPVVVALTSLLPRFVAPVRLSRAYGLEAASYNVAAIAGPGLAAALAATAGGQYAGAAIVASALVGVLALPLLPFPAPGTTPEPHPDPLTSESTPGPNTPAPADSASDGFVRSDSAPVGPTSAESASGDSAPGEFVPDDSAAGELVAEETVPEKRGAPGWAEVLTGGLTVLAHGRVLRALTVATTLAWLGFGGTAVTAVLLAEHIGAPPSAGGRLLMAMAVGSLLGALASSRWLTPGRAEPVMIGGLVAFGAALAAVAAAPSVPWAMAAFAAAGAAEGPVFAATLMLRQRESPADRLGQVNTTGGSLKISASALGAALTAAFADAVGPVGLVLAIAAFQFAGAAAGLVLLRVPRRVRENRSTGAGSAP